METRQRNLQDGFTRRNHPLFRTHEFNITKLKQYYKTIKYIWVKAHVGIKENEIVDQRANKARTGTLGPPTVEKPQQFGDVVRKDMLVSERADLKPGCRALPKTLDATIMNACRSPMAKRAMLKIERWKNQNNYWDKSVAHCVLCNTTHKLTFEYTARNCSAWAPFRKDVKQAWAELFPDIPFYEDLLFGWIRKGISVHMNKISGERGRLVIIKYLKKWEKILKKTRP